ncbi:MAG: DUF4139 domain-containing protein [Candidatus Cloacimonetes bacterium]|nr:DUF4139 domain-containing protein [Candidatus Cloacimonadota bacterium]
MLKRIFIIILLSSVLLYALDNLTIYNDNLAVFKTELDLHLQKGIQNYLYNDIPERIEPSSLIFSSKNKNLFLFSQNYEYDLADTDAILKKYINSNISIIMKDNTEFDGILLFFNMNTIGLQDEETKELNLLNKQEIKSIKLLNLPSNFYTKPTLNWQLNAPLTGKYPVTISYITRGLSWYVTYNAVLIQNKVQISPWVTINNQSGKSYDQVVLKLVAGELNKVDTYRAGNVLYSKDAMMERSSPTFEEKSFADYHLYTLDQKASINDKQIKQMLLFDTKEITIERIYRYDSSQYSNNKVKSTINFKNTKKNGLGIPLPKGIVKLYQYDDADNNIEFIGEDDLPHTSIDQNVLLTIGNAFDVIANTKIIKDIKIGNDIEQQFEVKIQNKKIEPIKLIISHYIGNNNYKIIEKNFEYTEKDAYTITIERNIKAGETDVIRWTQRIKRR